MLRGGWPKKRSSIPRTAKASRRILELAHPAHPTEVSVPGIMRPNSEDYRSATSSSEDGISWRYDSITTYAHTRELFCCSCLNRYSSCLFDEDICVYCKG